VVPSLPFIQQPQPAAEVLSNVKPVVRTASILRWNKITPPVRIEVERGSDTFSSSEIQPLNSTSTSTSLLPVATDKRRISVSFMMDSGGVQQASSTTQSACLLSNSIAFSSFFLRCHFIKLALVICSAYLFFPKSLHNFSLFLSKFD